MRKNSEETPARGKKRILTSSEAVPHRGDIFIKRIYDGSEAASGYRVLVDRLWPRGIKKDKAGIDLWMKEIAPSQELRAWFRHDPEKWTKFKERYEEELAANQELTDLLCERMQHGPLTLLYGAKNTTCNHAVVLKDHLLNLQR